jgi:hypothetical protein
MFGSSTSDAVGPRADQVGRQCDLHRCPATDPSRQWRMSWLDSIPLWLIIAVAAWMAVAPIVPEPHLVEKLRMLAQGTLRRPIDIFDLLFHAAPIVVLVLKLLRIWQMRGGA